ncbi:glycoside hydrolase family 16 protein [Apiospora phragmitis]|uniref:Glycoside hydrolase family 16 protein n=1 Tax=Apiospora phragmitis TaxID=2905665 RepID=A0ABR1TU30_9PEZI
MRGFSLLASALPLAGVATAYPRVDGPGAQFVSRAAGKTVIPKDSFGAFDTYWSHNYPWGTDHNGGARMNPSKVSTANDVLTLTASPASGEPPATNGGTQYPVHYLSGTVFAKQQLTVKPGGGYDLEADFKAPVARGTWPAFWLTAVKGWPPEINVAEWKGSGKISFNTFNTSSQVAAHDVTYPSPDNIADSKLQVAHHQGPDPNRLCDGRMGQVLHGRWRDHHSVWQNYVNSAFYLIIDLQMEGSSGSPGPSAGTTFQIRNVQVTGYNP